MVSANTLIGYGAVVTFSGISGEMTNISFSGFSAADVDVTHFQSPNYWKEYKPGLRDAGEVTIDLAFNQDQELPVTRTVDTLTITFPVPSGKTNGAVFQCSAYIKNYPITVPLEEKQTAQFVFKLTGEPSFTASS